MFNHRLAPTLAPIDQDSFHRLHILGQAINALRAGSITRLVQPALPDMMILAAENLWPGVQVPSSARLIFAGNPAWLPTLIDQMPARDVLASWRGVEHNLAHAACFALARHAEILPLLIIWPAGQGRGSEPVIHPSDWERRGLDEATTIQPMLMTPVALQDAANHRLVLFRVPGIGTEHLALLIGQPEDSDTPVVRVHSQCMTGDLMGSLRCDCGPQLRGAIRTMGSHEGGIILYLAHEGRAIGLANKLRAYGLQDNGLDTVDANLALGMGIDNRDYHVAAAMLRHLGIGSIRLMTNNPAKISGLEQAGIHITARVPHIHGQNDHNRHYLAVKRDKTGHLL